jgi:hypothetical protein
MTGHRSRNSRQRYHDLAAQQMMHLHYAPGVWGARHGLVDRAIWAAHCADPGWIEKSDYGALPRWSPGLLLRALDGLLSATAALRRSIGIKVRRSGARHSLRAGFLYSAPINSERQRLRGARARSGRSLRSPSRVQGADLCRHALAICRNSGIAVFHARLSVKWPAEPGLTGLSFGRQSPRSGRAMC